MQRLVSRTWTRKGFTLIELAVVIVIIGILAAFGVPKFLQSVEKSKASEAFNYFSALQSAQERYIAQNGIYATAVSALDIAMPAPQYFNAPTAMTTATTSGVPTWAMVLTRNVSSSSHGAYTVGWSQDGFDAAASSIPQAISP